MKTDLRLKQDIEEELHWDPKVNAAQIGVTVNQGTVSLLGTVGSFAEKWAAEEATRRVGGVRAIAQELTVEIQTIHKLSDTEIAKSILTALRADVFVPDDITATVQNGRVTLEGQTVWHYERESAARSIRNLRGVVGVENLIVLKPQASAPEVQKKVEAALLRQAIADSHSIHTDVTDGIVTLSGKASSRQTIVDATTAAWAAPGVTEVVDHVDVC